MIPDVLPPRDVRTTVVPARPRWHPTAVILEGRYAPARRRGNLVRLADGVGPGPTATRAPACSSGWSRGSAVIPALRGSRCRDDSLSPVDAAPHRLRCQDDPPVTGELVRGQ